MVAAARGAVSAGANHRTVELRDEIDRFLEQRPVRRTRRAGRTAVDLEHFAGWLEARKPGLDDVGVRELTRVRGRPRPRTLRVSRPRASARRLAAVRSFLRAALGPARVPDAAFAPRRSRRLARPAAHRRDRPDARRARGRRRRSRCGTARSSSSSTRPGCRSAEAVGLDLGDVDFEQELVHVRGKGGKERVVPLGEEAALVARALPRDARPQLASRRRERVLPLRARPPARHEHAAPHRRRTRTGCGTRSRRICSKAAPTCARSRSCSATRRSRRRRSTATSTASALRSVYDRAHPRS